MEIRIHNFLNRFKPGFGLLQNFRRTLPAKVPRDIESAQPNLIQSPIQNDTPRKQEDHVDSTAAIFSDIHIENERSSQPQFTEGPPRFVLAKDGSNDCLALLVNEEFLARLRCLFQANRDMSALDGPLYHAKMDAKNIERSVQNAQETLKTVENEEQAEEHQQFIGQQTAELLKINNWRNELEKEWDLVNGNLELSRSNTQWVLETAMREASLLGPEKPLPAILLRDEVECSEEEVDVPEHAMPAKSPAVLIASDHEEVQESEEDIQRRAAYEDFIDRSQLLDTLQANFDDQQDNYRENLCMFQQEVEAGTSKMSRSDFDRRSIQYGQQLTRALIDAEEAFEEAREHAQALGAIGSDYGQECYYGAEYEESWPENKVAEYIASQDWSSVEAWMDNVLDPTSQADVDSVEIDEWDAEEVDVNDSISVIDYEDYRRDIDRNRRICARFEDPCPEVRWLGQPDARVLERRSSCWM